ncbi:MAG: ribosome maturation factor RimM [Bacillota bacterium]
MNPEFVTIGKIVAPHGHRGAIRILPLTDFPERFFQMDTVTVFNGTERKDYVIESAGRHQRFILMKLAGINDMNAAERFRGALLQVPRAEVVPLPPGRYYVFEIVGLEVWSEEGTYLGKVSAVLETGANDVYSVQSPEGREILVPALREVVRKIDVAGNRMVVRLPEGLL